MDVEAAFRMYFPRIREKCRRMLRDPGDAEDVAQETFIRLWKANLQGGDARRVIAWVYRTSSRLALDRLRRQQAGPERVVDELLWSVPEDSHPETRAEDRQRLLQFAQHLPQDELEMVLLSRMDRLTYAEIAEVSQVSERTVRRTLRRFEDRVEQLRQGLEP
ncbi:RNA polymerase sigma factor [Hyalangium gracile]|uniref:RNA polymerase sigma factor n=1 Tax=Hyalangium gracile TaxID=394092 RepID=UPI001CCE58ED|nr:RNA polymerase sigma factor [Hyalangium gracile]